MNRREISADREYAERFANGLIEIARTQGPLIRGNILQFATLVLAGKKIDLEACCSASPELYLATAYQLVREFELSGNNVYMVFDQIRRDFSGPPIMAERVIGLLMGLAEVHWHAGKLIEPKQGLLQRFVVRQQWQPRSQQDRVSFVRSAANSRAIKQRLQVSDLAEEFIMGLPEASILRIVEAYIENKQLPLPDAFAVAFINRTHSEKLAPAGENLPLQHPVTGVLDYCRFFLDYIHPNTQCLPDVDWARGVLRDAMHFCHARNFVRWFETDRVDE